MKHDAADALEFARAADELWVARGKNVRRFDLTEHRPSDEELLKVMTGPTGTLRAPAIRIGKKLLIGFHSDMYQDAFPQEEA